MPAHRIALSLLVAAALPACVDDGTSSPPDDTTPPAVECKPNDYGSDEIVACGFGPKLQLIGADDERVYAVSDSSTYFAVDNDGVTTRLMHYTYTPAADQWGAVIHAGHIIVPSRIDRGSYAPAGLVSIDGSAAQEEPTTLLEAHQFEPHAGMIDGGNLFYAASTETNDECSYCTGRVVAISYDGGRTAR